MKKLNRAQVKEHARLTDKLLDAQEKLESAVEDFNNEISRMFEPVEVAKNALNELLTEIEEFRSETADEIRSYYDDKSETWQDGEIGEAIDTFADAWESESFEAIDLGEEPETLDVDYQYPMLDELPDEADMP